MNITRSVLICSLALGLSFSSVGRADNTPAYLTKADIKSLKVDEINLGKGARMFELSVSYNFSNDIRQAKLSCASLKACTVLQKEILSALSEGKKLALNFDSDQVVASIVEVKPAPPAPIPSPAEVACNESRLDVLMARKVAINFELTKDVRVESNQGEIPLGGGCFAVLRTTVAQPRILKSANRKFTGFVKNITASPQHAETSREWSAALSLNEGEQAPSFKSIYTGAAIQIETPFDPTIHSISCRYHNPNDDWRYTKPDNFEKAGFINSELGASGLIKTEIGASEACTKPIEAKVLTDYRDMSEALSLLGDKSCAGRNSSEADDAIGQKAVPSAESDVPTSIRQEKQEASAQTVI